MAVVVTRHRTETLVDALASLAKQTHPIAHLIVVDNGPDESVREVVDGLRARRHLAAVVAQPRRRGRVRARHAARDGARARAGSGSPTTTAARPTTTSSPPCVELADRRGLAAVSPTVADADDPDRLAFPVRRGLTWHRSRAALAADIGHGADHELLPGIAALFNGALFRASTLDVIGVPDLRLFIRGDEVEMHRRLVRSGLPFGTALGAVYLHPRADADDKPMLGGHLHARDPDDPVKRYYTFRNRGFLTAQPGMRRVGLAELPRFAWYFLVTKRSPREFARWLRLVRQGRLERFHRA